MVFFFGFFFGFFGIGAGQNSKFETGFLGSVGFFVFVCFFFGFFFAIFWFFWHLNLGLEYHPKKYQKKTKKTKKPKKTKKISRYTKIGKLAWFFLFFFLVFFGVSTPPVCNFMFVLQLCLFTF